METADDAEESKHENYSFRQQKLLIPACKTNMDSAILQSPLIGPSSFAKLPPLKTSTKEMTRTSEEEIIDSAGDLNEAASEQDYNTAETQDVSNAIIPHPPSSSRLPKTKGKRPNHVRNNNQTCNKNENGSDSESTQKLSDTDSRTGKCDVEDLIGQKLQEDNRLLDSYENYLRQLSKEEDELPEEEASDSDSDSTESSSSSFSVSSLSSNDQEKDSRESDVGIITETFEPLYSLPIKPKKPKDKPNDSTNEVNNHLSANAVDNRLTEENNRELSKESLYGTMNQTLMDAAALRTQSAPDLRNSLQTRTLDTFGYMCPNRLPKLDIKDTTLSSPELKQTTFNPKYRPLPTIPLQRTQKDSEDTIYEKIATQNLSESIDSQARSSKMSFKAVANRVVSLMPRLTTREARSRESDHYMADIIKYLPDKKLRIFVGTWNMKGIKVIPDSLDDYLLPKESVFIQDIYAIGCQEGTPFRKEWEICLQETLGPTHVLMYSGNFGVLQLSIFVRRELVWFCTSIEQDTVATRIAHKIKTKGAMAVSFNVFGTSLLFINSHFASDQQKVKERIADYKTICRSLSIPIGDQGNSDRNADVTSRFDRVFWFGDFNFRVNKTRAETDSVFAERSFENRHERKDYIIKELFSHDQLHGLLRKGKIFHGFHESAIDFLPTYKFDVNTDTYDSSAKKRVPSWTDRVLYRSRQPDQIKVTMYNSCTTINGSDHRPVFAIIEANIEPVKKNAMLPCAMFDREIYLEANMRRSAPKGNQQSSNVCAIL